MAMARRPSRLLLAVAGTLLLVPALFLGTVFAQTGTPGPPTVDTVSAGDRALTAGWSEPSDTGTAIITAYDLRYILTSSDETVDANWTVQEDVWSGAGDLRHTAIGLDNNDQYDVQVRAVNSRGDGAWSATMTGTPADHGNSRGSATDIALQTPTLGYIASSSDVDFFEFTLDDDSGVFIFTTSYVSGFLATTGELQNSSGNRIKDDEDGPEFREHGDQLFIWDDLSAGTYYVMVEAPEAGYYTLHTQPVHNSTNVDDAVGLNLGGRADGIMAVGAEDEDYFRLEVSATTDVMIWLPRAKTGLDPLGTLLDAEGEVVAKHDDSFLDGDRSKHFIIRESLTAGVYFLKVSGAPTTTFDECKGFTPEYLRFSWENCEDTVRKTASTVGGPYTVAAVAVPARSSSRSSATPLALGEGSLAGGRIDTNSDSDYFSLSVDEPTHVKFEVVSADIETEGTFYGTDGSEKATFVSDTDYLPGALGFTLYASLEAGTSYVQVKSDDGLVSGPFAIRVTVDEDYPEFLSTCTGLTTSYSDPLYGCQWSMNNTGQNTGGRSGTAGEDINVEDVWAGGNLGEGINVAIVDNGLYYAHEDLKDNVDTSRNHDYTPRGNVFERHFFHGTAMAGLIAARDNSVGMRGVAPRANIYVYNALRSGSFLSLSDAAARNRDVTAVSNNSWGFINGPGLDPSPRFWQLAIDAGVTEGLDGKGVFYVFAGGNGAREGDYSNLNGLATYYAVTTACAVNDQGQRPTYSEEGPNLWVCAPSGDSGRQGELATVNYDRYRNGLAGTSTSTALVSGVAALVRKANAALTWRDVKLVLAGSARKNDASDSGWATGATKYGSATDTYNFNHQYGFGVVDAKAAVDLAATWTNVPAMKHVTAGSAGDLDLAIADSGSASNSISAGGGIDFIEHVDVYLETTHQSFRDLKVELTSPAGATSVLSVSHDSDDKYPLNGEFRFGTAAHLGEGSSGTWRLRLTDEVTGTAGTLKSWRLKIYGHSSSEDVPAIASVTPEDAKLIVGWTALDDDAVTAYDVRHIASNAPDKTDANWTVIDDAVTSGSGGLSDTISGLTNGTSYDVQVRAVRGSDDGAWSGTVVGTPTAGSAAVPAIDAVRSEDTALNVSWSAPATPPSTTTAYDVRHKRSDANSWTVVDDAWTEGELTYTITGLDNGVSYDAQVRHVGTGDGTWSTTGTGQPSDFGSTVETAGTLPLDSPVQGVINGAGDVDVLKLELATAKYVWFYTTGDTDTVAELLTSEEVIIGADDDGELPDSGSNFLLPTYLDAGTYYLRLRGFRNTTGDYVLWAEEVPDSTSRSNAVPLPLDSPVRASFDVDEDIDYFKLELTTETDVLLRSTGRWNPRAKLTNSSGDLLDSDNDGWLPTGILNFFMRATLAAGVYYLEVDEVAALTGPYVIHAETMTEPGSTSADAYELTLGVAGGGSIDPADDTDYFTFTLTERTRTAIAAFGVGSNGAVLKVTGELLDSSLNSVLPFPMSEIDFDLAFSESIELSAGTYYIKMTSSTGTDTEDYAVIVVEDLRFDQLAARCPGSLIGLTDAFAGCQWHLVNEGQFGGLAGPDLNVEGVWDAGYDGDGITIAIVDDGLDYEHEDLSANVDTTQNYNYYIFDPDLTVNEFNPRHGTAVAGIIAADDNDIGVRGVAPGATIYGYNLLQLSSFINEADAMTRQMATTAVNSNSWGPADSGLPQAATSLWKLAVESGITDGYGGKGVFYVWAGGNGGDNDYSSLDEYASFYGVTAVCAVNYLGKRADYSDRGSSLWVCGPSSDSLDYGLPGILTTDLGNSYRTDFGGTSAAAPMVSGVAALMREANSALTWRDIKLILAASARKVDANSDGWERGALKFGSTSERYSFNYDYGFGLVDAQAAVDMARSWSTLPAFRQISMPSRYLGVRIPEYSGGDYLAAVTDSITVEPYVNFVEYVQVEVELYHTSFRDLHIELISPSGAVSVLTPGLEVKGTGKCDVFPLCITHNREFTLGTAKHLGENGAGVWQLRITDLNTGGTGILQSWGITVYGHGDGPGFAEIDTLTRGDRSATIEWTAPVITGNSTITSYDVRYRGDEQDSEWALVESIWTSGTLSYTLTGLEGGSKYDVQIRARSSTRAGPWSEPEDVEPRLTAPTAPSITAVDPGNQTLGVTWTPPPEAVGDEITSYDLRYILTTADETDPDNWTVRTSVWTSGPLDHAQGGLTNGSGYDVQVRADNGKGDGAWSASDTGTPADQLDVRLQWASSATTVNENAATVTLQAEMVTTEAGTLPGGFFVDVDVAVSGTADTPADYTLQTTSLRFFTSDFSSFDDGGQTRYRAVADVDVDIVNDVLNESSEQISLALVYDAPALPHLLGNNANLAVTITDDDDGAVAISWEQSTVTVDEDDGTVTLRAVATTAQNEAPGADFVLEASVSSIAGTAARSADYTPLAKNVVFSGSSFRPTTVDGQPRYRATVEVELPIVDDGDDEPDEELTVVLSYANPTLPGQQGPAATATITIKDNDFVPITISWDETSVSVDEHAGTVTLQARATTTVDKMPESGFTVDLSATTADGTATQGSDYRSVTSNFSFSQGDFTRADVGGQFRFQATRDINITITDDASVEPDEDFTVTLAYRGTLQSHWTGGSDVATVTIVDNEQPQVMLGWDETAFTVTEPTAPGGTTTVTLTAVAITLGDRQPEAGFTLDYTVATADGTATEPSDYEAVSQSVSIPSSAFTVDTSTGQTRWRATRTYTALIQDDTVDETDETFTVTLAFDDPSAPYLVAGDLTATITIEDNDHVAVTLGWQQTARTISEPTTSGGTTTVMLRAMAVTATNKQPETGFVLDFTVDSANGTAQEPADYEGVSDTESFAPSDFSLQTISGQSRYVASKDFTVTIADDVEDEPNETFTVTLRLSDASLPHLSEGDTVATVTIDDNDHVPVNLSWEQSSFTVDEDAGTVTLRAEVTTEVDKMPESGFDVSVSVQAVDGSATRNEDFHPLSTMDTFRQSDFSRVDTGGGRQRYRATREFEVTVLEDAMDESNEQFEVALSYSNPTLPHLRGSSAEATVTINDNDHVPVTLGWEKTELTAEEPTSVGATTSVVLRAMAVTSTDKQPESGFTFDFTVSTVNGTARQPDDYEELSRTATFDRIGFEPATVDGQSRWVASQTFTVEVEHDTVDEPLEDFTVTLAFVGGSQPYLLQGDMTATVTITDDAASLSDLRTTVNADRSIAAPGDRITYDWSVGNSGPADTTGTVLTATLDGGVTFVSAVVTDPSSGQCSRSGVTVTCTFGTLSVDGNAEGMIVVDVSDTASADLGFTATARGDQLDSTPADNVDSATTELDAPPRKITNLSASASAGNIDLTWSAPGDNGSAVTRYELERKAGTGNFVRLTAPDPAALLYRDDDVEEGTDYTYRLRAVNFDGEAEWSNESTAELRVTPPPPPPITGGGGGGFGAASIAPKFADGFRTTRSVVANARAGGLVGEPVAATHPDDLEVTYSLSGADAALFTVDEDNRADSGEGRDGIRS